MVQRAFYPPQRVALARGSKLADELLERQGVHPQCLSVARWIATDYYLRPTVFVRHRASQGSAATEGQRALCIAEATGADGTLTDEPAACGY